MAAYTVQDLITEALAEIVAVPAGDTPPAEDLATGLAVLKRMVDASNVHRGNIATERIDVWPLIAATQTYTIGVDPAGVLTPTFAAVRPVRIERANIIIGSGTSAVRRPLNLLDDTQWAAKSYQTASGLPFDLYNDEAYPLSTYFLYPIPADTYHLETYTWQQFAQSALADKLAIPPGYLEFWLYGLAVRLAPIFGKAPSPTTVTLFAEAREAVAALNCPSPRIRSDRDLQTVRGREFYGWLDGYQGR